MKLWVLGIKILSKIVLFTYILMWRYKRNKVYKYCYSKCRVKFTHPRLTEKLKLLLQKLLFSVNAPLHTRSLKNVGTRGIKFAESNVEKKTCEGKIQFDTTHFTTFSG